MGYNIELILKALKSFEPWLDFPRLGRLIGPILGLKTERLTHKGPGLLLLLLWPMWDIWACEIELFEVGLICPKCYKLLQWAGQAISV